MPDNDTHFHAITNTKTPYILHACISVWHLVNQGESTLLHMRMRLLVLVLEREAALNKHFVSGDPTLFT